MRNSFKKSFCFFFSVLYILTSAVTLSAQDDMLVPDGVPDPEVTTEQLLTISGGQTSNITLELKGVDILDVLKVLSKKSGLNIVAGKNVRGQVTLFLQDVDVWDALKIILETSELAYELKGDIIKVITKADYEAMYGRPYEDKKVTELIRLEHAKASALSDILNQLKSNIGRVVIDEATNSLIVMDTPESLRSIRNAVDEMDVAMKTKVYNLKYAKAEDLENKLSEIITPNVGTIKIDARTNKIIVTDIPSKQTQIGEIIDAFDSKPRQVVIEAKIVEVVLDDEYALGIDWKLVMDRTKSDTYGFESDGLNISALPTSSTNLSSFTINSSTDSFNAVISTLQEMGKTNTLSNPRVTVLNNEEAKIAVATRQPFVSQTVVQGDSTSTTADNVEFVDVGVTLTVTPTITEDNFIIMEVKPEVSTAGDSLTIQGADSGTVFDRTVIPIVTSQQVETKVIVKSSNTLVLGGLIQDSQSVNSKKVPVLGDIPILGAVFRSKQDTFNKTELVLFLTPKILEPTDRAEGLDRFFNEDGTIVKFNDFGGKGYEFTENSTATQPVFQVDEQPFWEKSAEAQVDREMAKKKALAQARAAELVDIMQKKSFSAVDKKVSERASVGAASVLSDASDIGSFREQYISQVKSLVFNAIKNSPAVSKLSGRVAVSLTIQRSGFLKKLDVQLLGNPMFDGELILLVNACSPYPQIPKSIIDNEININFSFDV